MKILPTGFLHYQNTKNNKEQQSHASRPSAPDFDTYTKSSTGVSFKGLSIIDMLFKEKDEILSKDEALYELKKADIEYSSQNTNYAKFKNKKTDRILSLLHKNGGYSKKLIEKTLDLKSAPHSRNYAEEYLKLCGCPYEFNNKVFEDIKKLIEKGFENETVIEIIKLGLRDNKKYNSLIAGNAIEYYDAYKDDIRCLLDSATNKKGKFQQDIFRKYIKLATENIFHIDFFPILTRCSSNNETGISSKEIDKVIELIELGLRPIHAVNVVQSSNSGLKCPDADLLNSLTENIPDIKDPDVLYKFLIYRTQTSCYQKDSQYKLNRDSFELFNAIQKKGNYNNSLDMLSIHNALKLYKDETVIKKKNKQKFYNTALELAGVIPLEYMDNTLRYINKSDAYSEAMKMFHTLKPSDRSKFADLLRTNENFNTGFLDKKIPDAFIELYEKYSDKYSLELLFDVLNNCKQSTTREFKHQKFRYAKDHLEEKDLDFSLDLIRLKDKDTDTDTDYYDTDVINIEFAKKLLEAGFDKKLIKDAFKHRNSFFKDTMPVEQKNKCCQKMIELNEKGITQNYIFQILNADFNDEQIEKLADIRSEAIKRRDILSGAGIELSDKNIDEVFLKSPEMTLNTLNTVGKDTLLYSFSQKIDNVENYIETIGALSLDNNPDYEQLVLITNPSHSKRFRFIEIEIADLKHKLKISMSSQDKETLINQINSKTKEKNDLIKNAIKDPKDKLETASIFAAITEAESTASEDNNDTDFIFENENNENTSIRNRKHSASVKEILPYMNPKTEEQKKEYNQQLNKMLYAAFEMETPDDTITEMLDFKTGKYIPTLFNTDEDFKDNFAALVQILEESTNTDTLEIFNQLPQNQATKNQFKKLGLNYDRWVKYNPDSYIKVIIQTDIEKQQQSAIKNLEADFNDELFKRLPETEKQQLFDALNKEGYKAVEKEEAIYEGEGFYNGTKKVLRLYKNDTPIVFEDMDKIIKILKNELNIKDFWNKKHDDKNINNAKETIKNHILKMRYKEVKNASEKKADKAINLQIQKADMNDISHALFLGNDSSCCTAVGTGINMWTAPNYIKNKLISCIEVKDGDNYAGNTMCFIAKINGKASLVLDNIELKPKYQFNDKIRDAIIEYAAKLTQELGKPDMPIYTGANRHKVNLNSFPMNSETFSIIGSTGDDEIYLDFDSDPHQIDEENEFTCELYRIK